MSEPVAGASRPNDDVAQLTAALSDRYRLERELGRGGMATVYLVHDIKHERHVALKVLHPDIGSGLGSDRFLREIRLTARLQHSHILPVFDSGEVGGRLWYTMPYVRGESLRERLAREVQLPVQTALEITGQVAQALDYAHRQGAVHRDIKPGNILLSDSQVLVADFGIARAVGSTEEEQLTATGVVVGTPAYMSPEQASGGQVDGRTDVYALGCVLYEMLAGEAPFTGPTAQAIIAKRFAHQPPSLRVVRPNVPAVVDEAIQRALALVPADRFARAAEFAEALTAPAAPVSAIPRDKSQSRQGLPRRLLTRGILAAAVLTVAATGFLIVRALRPRPPTLLSTGVVKEREKVLVADFESHTPDSMVAPAVTEAFRIDFAGSPVVTVVPSATVAAALERMRRPAASRLTAELAREVAIREGIKAVVTGQVSRVSGSMMISVQLVSAATGDVLAAHRETAPDSTQVIAAIDRLSGRLRERIGESLRSVRGEPPLTEVTTSSMAALNKYIQGQVAGDVYVDYAKAVALLEEAVALDTGFATAYRTLGAFHLRLGNRERGVEALGKAMQYRDRLTEMEREHTRAIYHMFVTGELDQAATIYRTLLERYPDDSLASNNLAVTYYSLHQFAAAESIWRAGLDTIHPWTPGGQLNLATGLVALGRRAEAERMVAQAAKLFPHAAGVEWYRIRLAALADDYVTARSRTLAAGKRYDRTPFDRAFTDRDLAAIALARGRLAEAEAATRDGMAKSLESGYPADYLKDAATLGFIDAWFRRQPARGIRKVEAALERYPLDSIRLLERPYLTLAVAYAVAARPERARALLGEYERRVKPLLRRIDEPMRLWTLGQIALAEGRLEEAVAHFESYVPTPRDCLPCGQAELAQAFDRLGNLDSAIAVFERYLTTPSMYRLNGQGIFLNGQGIFYADATQLGPACKRLGELYEQRGNPVKAMEYYSRFIRLWGEADAELQPEVVEVRERLRQLGGEGGVTSR